MTTTTPTLDDLAVIQARAEAATDGSWRSEEINSSRDCYAVRIPNKQGYAELTKADAEFVAHARADLLGVIALAQRQQVLLNAVTQKAQDFVMKPVGSLSSIEQPGFGRGVRAAGRELRAVLEDSL